MGSVRSEGRGGVKYHRCVIGSIRFVSSRVDPCIRRRSQANVAPIPNPCQLQPIAALCRFERFQARSEWRMVRSTSRFAIRYSPFASYRCSAPIANSERGMARSASLFAIRYSPITSYQTCAIFLNEKNNMTHFDISKRENHLWFSNCDGLADRRSPRCIQKPHER
jgi:hypothetical protein